MTLALLVLAGCSDPCPEVAPAVHAGEVRLDLAGSDNPGAAHVIVWEDAAEDARAQACEGGEPTTLLFWYGTPPDEEGMTLDLAEWDGQTLGVAIHTADQEWVNVFAPIAAGGATSWTIEVTSGR